jgi:hypothetical protein
MKAKAMEFAARILGNHNNEHLQALSRRGKEVGSMGTKRHPMGDHDDRYQMETIKGAHTIEER